MSAYKTIFTTVSDPDSAAAHIARVAAFAEALDAHLDVLCLGIDRTQFGYYAVGGSALVLQECLTRASEQAEACAAVVRQTLEASAIHAAVESEIVSFADVARRIAFKARFSDLIVLPQPYADGAPPEQEAITEAALFEVGAPVLVLPVAEQDAPKPRHITLAWNESGEAMRAIRAALPMLQQADQCQVVVIDPPTHSATRSDPGGSLAQWLSRHGVNVEIAVLTRTMPRIADVLGRHLQESGSDLLVMGAYGHSRFREAILGGATRDMLEQAKLPVLMTH